MNNLPNLFKLIELTRSQVQYGYVLSGVRRHELSNLAEHHYLVTFMAWQMAEHLNSKGAKLDTKKVLELCMVHDLGELFGGDISRPYAMANPKARKLAKEFEQENLIFLQKYLTNLSKETWDDMMEPVSDEALIFKLADIMECAHFLKYMGHYKPLDTKILEEKMPEVIGKLKNQNAKKELLEFYKHWIAEIQSKSATEMMFDQ